MSTDQRRAAPKEGLITFKRGWELKTENRGNKRRQPLERVQNYFLMTKENP